MIKITFKGPKPGDLLRAATTASGGPASIELQGSDAAIAAARSALER